MTRRDATFIGWSVFTAATGLAYAAVIFMGVPLLRYYPLEHAWHWGAQPGVPSQAWYFHQLAAFAAGAVCGGAAYVLCARRAAPDRARTPAFWRAYGVAVVAVIVASMAYMLYYEFRKWGILA
jgi:hypothetical protein